MNKRILLVIGLLFILTNALHAGQQVVTVCDNTGCHQVVIITQDDSMGNSTTGGPIVVNQI